MSTKDIFIVIPTSVISQAFFRCAFVYCYHKVEAVIEKSIERHEQQSLPPLQSQTSSAVSNNSSAHDLSETTKLKLELNDASAGIAAGVGFGFFHTVMLYGTLLASENSRTGTLYQDSCTIMPSIFNSALMAFCFGVLDLVWMPLTFYGMRRLKDSNSRRSQSNVFGSNSRNEDTRQVQDWMFQRDELGGKAALALVLLSHFAAAFATLPNQIMAVNGCVLALPLLGLITVITVLAFWYFCKDHYLPREQRQRIQMARHRSR